MKTVYFVRHGESEGNAGPLRQSPDTPLTELGKEQARIVAARAAKLSFETVLSSTYARARETADYIVDKTGKPIEYTDLFVERRRSSVVIGQAKNDPAVLAAEAAILSNFATPGYRHSDEENFDDLKERAAKALAYLTERGEESLLVVTHGFFLRILLAYAFFGEGLTGRECELFIQKLRQKNTGLTVLTYDREELPRGWSLTTWNDHAHLG
ncbi:MAG TPA: histidine phosphatase family protein [Candidatus Paceibacterota bacterium]|nr:histidine phosphatase family protein [Candidatus Paceibacterota bacterium]